MRNLTPQQVSHAIQRALIWNGGRYIADEVPCLTPEHIIKFAGESFHDKDSKGYRSMKHGRGILGFFAKKPELLDTGTQKGRAHIARLKRTAKKLSRYLEADRLLFIKRSQMTGTLESIMPKYMHNFSTFDILMNLIYIDVDQRIREHLTSARQLELYVIKSRTIRSWILPIIRFMGQVTATITFEEIMAKELIAEGSKLLCKSTVLSSYLSALMVNSPNMVISYAKFAINDTTNGPTVISPQMSPLILGCCNYLGTTDYFKNLSECFYHEFVDSQSSDEPMKKEIFYGFDYQDDLTAYFALVEGGHLTVFGLCADQQDALRYDALKEACFKYKDIEAIEDITAYHKEVNFYFGGQMLLNQLKVTLDEQFYTY